MRLHHRYRGNETDKVTALETNYRTVDFVHRVQAPVFEEGNI